jgi:tetratricopeptide (TPR) repeat protein
MASHPAKIGKYTVEGILGRGGMGVVYKAVDAQIDRYVAIKMINAGGDESLFGRFTQEAKSMGQLTCPNIVTVFDFGEQDGNPYLVMQFLAGSSLESLIQKRASLSLSEKLGIIIDVCNGLAYAHQRGVIHRDIKPANIMVLQDGVNDGMAVIVDFGIARIGGDARLTKTDQIVGSVHYMSVEQLQARELDNRTDVYATGVVFFQLLTGMLPFDSPDTASTLLKIVNEPPPPLSLYLKDYPVELDAIVTRVLAKDRDERYASAKDLAFDLMQVQDHLKSETVAQLVRRAETLLEREDWTRAREQLQQAQRIDRHNTQVQKMLTAVHERLRQQQQIEQARGLRHQADEAYMEQRYDDALRILDQAVALDGSNSDLLAFRDSVRLARERATGLRRALRRAEAALQDGDLDEAESAVGEAFKIDPQDTQAKALKGIIAQQAEEKLRREQVRKLLDEARNQIAARKLTAAFTIIRNAESLDPTSNELQTVKKLALAAREQEKRRAETDAMRQQIEAALSQEDYATAAAKAEEGIRKFPDEQSLLKLKSLVDAQRLRVEQKRFVREQFSAANSLADSGQLRRAVAVLEQALQKAPGNSELESLRATLLDRAATEEAGQRRQQALETTIAEGERVLQQRGARAATAFLAARASEYSDSQQFRELYDSVREREALEVLDGRLASEPNPVRQVQLAEEALRYNPSNRWIQQRVVDLQRVKTQISGAVDRAEDFEAAGSLAEALREWRQLSNAYPKVTEFTTQVRRIENLQAERQRSKVVQPRVVPEPPKPVKPAEDLSATRMLNSEIVRDVAPAPTTRPAPEELPKRTPTKIGPTVVRETPSEEPALRDDARQPENFLAGPGKYVVVAVAVSVLAVVIYLLVRGGGQKPVTVKITTDPPSANVTIGTQSCQAPCQLSLKVGTYTARVEREGYESKTQEVTVAADTKELPVLSLPPPPPPPPLPHPDQGTLIVSANVADATVLVDGKEKGFTDSRERFESKIDVGGHDVMVKKSGYEDSTQHVEIAKGELASIKPELKKNPGPVSPPTEPTYLVVTTHPNAAITIDRTVIGNADSNGRLIWPVTPGSHTIGINLIGYEAYSRVAEIKTGEKHALLVSLTPLPKPTITFSATPNTIPAGQPVTLSWQTQNADQVEIEPGVGPVDKSGARQVSPRETTTYTLTAKGPGGSVPRDATVSVQQPPKLVPPKIVQFEVGTETISKGETTKLIWSTENATDVSIDQGVGSKLSANGSRQVKPEATTTYTLTAKNASGDAVSGSRVITVETAPTPPPPPPPNPTSDLKCVDRFKDAYESLAIDELQKVWPSLDSRQRNAFRDSFKGAQAIKIEEQQCVETPSGSADITQYRCSETVTYTINGRRQPPTKPATVEFVCKKAGEGWIVAQRTIK